VIAAIPARVARVARATTVVAALLAAALLLALALSPRADAHAHSAACTRATGRSRHGARSCAAGNGRSHRHGKPHSSHTKPAHRHPAKGVGAAGGGEEGEEGESGQAGGEEEGAGQGGGNTPAASTGAHALCEDNSAPEPVEGGENGSEEAFVCDDGSEPACDRGLSPVVSGDGLQLLCETASDDR
jgi:uncharacterized membrane protein